MRCGPLMAEDATQVTRCPTDDGIQRTSRNHARSCLAIFAQVTTSTGTVPEATFVAIGFPLCTELTVKL